MHRPFPLLVGASLELLVRAALFLFLLAGTLALRLEALDSEGMKKSCKIEVKVT
jgi:hypothetical protein